MEVTRSNLKALLPLIQDVLGDAHFVAIDTELTGLNSQNTEHPFDTLEERYHKLKQNCGEFLIIQFGLSAFHYHRDEKTFTHTDFNFYVFPRPYSKQAPDKCFRCQPSSLEYLLQNGFDFNKLLREGIPYLTPDQELKMKAILAEKHKDELESLTSNKTKNRKPMVVPEEQKPFLEGVINQVDTLLQNDEKELKLPACNAYVRKLIYQTVNSEFRTGIDLSFTENVNRENYITVTKVSEEERRDLIHKRHSADLDELDEAIGFRKVLELITQTKKLVIGHNMLLDMLHVINQFYHPLPETLDEYKQLLHDHFPHLLDTKTMSSLPPFKEYFNSTALGPLLNQLQDKSFGLPKFKPADGFKGYELSEHKEHEAGYDAFITGLCFAGLLKRLAFNKKLLEEYVPANSKYLRSFINRIFIMRHYDITCLNINEVDPEPSRDHVFYVTFPHQWQTTDLVELFSPYGHIYVSWLNDSSALVALKSPQNKQSVKTSLVPVQNIYKVRPYSEYLKMGKLYRAPFAWESQPASKPQADLVLPNKRRRSSGSSASEQQGKHDVEPVPEEEEEKELSNSSKNSAGSSPTLKKSPRKIVPDDSSERGAKRTKVCTEEIPSKSKKPEKIFAEPAEW